MSTSARLQAVHPVLMVRDVNAALAFYERLGFAKSFCDDVDRPRYAGVQRDGVELHLQWHDASEWVDSVNRPNYRFVVLDVDALHAEFQANGVLDPHVQVQDTPWGTREFHMRDLDHNGLQFYRDR